MTADKLVDDTTASATHFISVAATRIGVNVISIYAKKAERDFVRIASTNSTTSGAFFNLSTGQLGTTGGTAFVTASIVDVGNGWYRCSMTTTDTGTVFFGASPSDGTLSYTGDGTSGIFIWGAQISDSASLDPYDYNPGAAPASTAYFGPRFDYDPVTLAPKGLLIEEQRTNLVLRSQDYSATWFTANVTATANTTDTLDPAGVNGSTKFVMGASGGALGQSVISTAVAHTASIYLKTSSGTTTVDLVLYRNSPFGLVASKTVTLTTSWQRFDVTGTFLDTTSHNFQINLGTNKTVYVWGAQLEAGAFPTSYIPTTTAAATRAADVAVMTGANFSNWYNQTEGSLFVEAQFGADDVFINTVALAPLSSATTTLLNMRRGSSGSFAFNVAMASATQASLPLFASVPLNTVAKMIGAYKVNDFAATANGGVPTTDNSGDLPTVDRMVIGGAWNSNLQIIASEYLNGHIRRVAYFPRRLSNAELQGITA
jgi:hypothetical protein